MERISNMEEIPELIPAFNCYFFLFPLIFL